MRQTAPGRPVPASTTVVMLIFAALVSAAGRAADAPPPPSPAQPGPAAPAPPPVTGKVVALQERVLTIHTVDHGDVPVTLVPGCRIVMNRPGTLADVRAGAFIGTTAVEGADGRLRATEVHVFPEEMRGTGEGHYPWGNAPATTMTNGNVTSMTNGSVAERSGSGAAAGLSITVAYRGGQTPVEVGPDVPVAIVTLIDASRLTAGTDVLAIAQPDVNGGINANLVAVLPPPPPK